MVGCCLLISLLVAALHQFCLARKYIREPTIVLEIDRVLTHAVFADVYAFPSQCISLMACCARSPWAMSDKDLKRGYTRRAAWTKTEY
jgi:hypothetical protein